MSGQFNLSPREFASAFPFHFVLDRELRLVQIGHVLERLCPELHVGVRLDAHFTIDRPALSALSLTAIREQAGSVFTLQHRIRSLRLRGEMKVQDACVFFLGSPWVTELAEVTRLGLGLNDFAAHDSITDFLFVLQAQRKTIADAQRLSERLKQQRQRLHDAREEARNAAEAAKEASRAKSDFLAVMSHEIRTPLNGVLGMLALLQKSALGTDEQQYVETSIRSGKALLTIINDILDFSKVEARKLELERVEFNLWEAIEDAIDSLSHEAHAKGLEVGLSISMDVPALVAGDPGRLRQVLTNYLSNAIKFSPQGSIKIGVCAPEHSASDVLVKIEVRDTGVGIPEERQTKLFQPFMQADSSTTRKFGGTGLGLAVCKQLAQLMGGDVGVSSSEGAGSTFWFSVRVQKVPELPQIDRVRAFSDLRVLAVHARPQQIALALEALRGWGAQLDTADTAREALHLVAAAATAGAPYHVVLAHVLTESFAALCSGVATSHSAATTLVAMGAAGDGLHDRMKRNDVTHAIVMPVRLCQLRHVAIAALGLDVSAVCGEGADCAVHAQRLTRSRFTGNVLLAEDDLVNQQVAKLHLESHGLKVHVVPNGEAAVEAVMAGRYDAVFMDLHMPRMDGLEATRTIRQLEHNGTRTAIIAWTASVTSEDRERCMQAGSDAVLTKPFDPEELQRMLVRFFTSTSTPSPVRRGGCPRHVVCAERLGRQQPF